MGIVLFDSATQVLNSVKRGNILIFLDS